MPVLPAEHWRTVDAPFTPPDAWRTEHGTCTRCGHAAQRGHTRWWHVGQPCRGSQPAWFRAD